MKRSITVFTSGFIVLMGMGLVTVFVIDSVFYPNASLSLTWWQKIGLPVNETISSSLLPKANTKEDLEKFKPQTLYWVYNEKDFSGAKGYACGVEGKILSKDSVVWKIMTGKGQEITLNMTGEVKYLLRNPYYNEKTQSWQEGNRIADASYFDMDDSIRINWSCPVADPNEMLDDKYMLKSEYLNVIPESVSKAIPNESD